MSTYEISKSSLLSLKAEIIRKQEEVKNKQHENVRKKVPLVIKNKGVESRNEADTVEDLDLLEKSRRALEKKAQLYDKLSKSKDIDDDPASFPNRFLVRFKDKEKEDRHSEDETDAADYGEAENSDEEWVEYVDCLGRTRTCLKKDLEHFKSRDKDYKRDDDDEDVVEEDERPETPPMEECEQTEEPQLLSDDMRREMMRKQWEKEEMELQDKDNVHYQDLLFNEARTHGVGYFGFSKDEYERKKQQESLEKLRLETLEQQKKSQELKAMRERQLAARIKAAKMRKRARLGLPLEDEEEEEKEAEIGPPVPQEIAEESKQSEEDALKERLLEEARKNHVRPWDVGKEKKNEFYEYSQGEWVEKRRKERNDEFAPPTNYRRDFRAPPPSFNVGESSSRSLKFSTKKNDNQNVMHVNPYKSNDDLQDPFNEDTRTFNPYKPTKKSNKRSYETMEKTDEKCVIASNNIEASIEAGLRFLREQSEKRDTSD